MKPTKPVPSPFDGMPSEVQILLLAIGVVIIAFVVWAVFIRRRPDELSGWGPSRSKYSASKTPRTAENEQHPRRKRRRRRDHRSRNPTLAETGGLPPIRQHSSSPDSGV